MKDDGVFRIQLLLLPVRRPSTIDCKIRPILFEISTDIVSQNTNGLISESDICNRTLHVFICYAFLSKMTSWYTFYHHISRIFHHSSIAKRHALPVEVQQENGFTQFSFKSSYLASKNLVECSGKHLIL